MEPTQASLNWSLEANNTIGTPLNWSTPSNETIKPEAGTAVFAAGSTLRIIFMAIGTFGFCSNLFVVIIIALYRPMHKQLTNIYIVNQSAMDAVVAMSLFLTSLIQQDPTSFNLKKGNPADEILCRLWYPKMPLWGMFVSSTYGIVMMTFERYLAVVYPIFHKTKFSRNRTVLAIILTSTWLFGPIFNSAYMWPLSGVTEQGGCNVLGYWPSVLTSQITGVFFIVVQYFFPLCVFTFCYSKMALVLHKRVETTAESGGEAKRNESMARARSNVFKTMALVALFFVLCWTMDQIYFLLFNLGFKTDFTSNFYNFCVCLVFVNCCSNPVIYGIKYEPFKKAVVHICCRNRVHPSQRMAHTRQMTEDNRYNITT